MVILEIYLALGSTKKIGLNRSVTSYFLLLDEDSQKMPPYKVARAGHYPMIYDRVTGIPWPCDPFKESPKEEDAEKDPSYIKLAKCPEQEEKAGKNKRDVKKMNRAWAIWRKSLHKL